MSSNGEGTGKVRFADRMLNGIETVGNKLPDPAALFVIALVLTWLVSAILGGHKFDVPRKVEGLQGKAESLSTKVDALSARAKETATLASDSEELPGAAGELAKEADGVSKAAGGLAKAAKKQERIVNQLSAPAMAKFLSSMVKTFAGFHPLGVVLVALLGVGVAERSGFINAVLKQLLSLTPKLLLTPMVILVAIVSHTAADAGYVLVIPLGGVIFYAAGRHPLAGIAAAFAGVSGGFSANFIPSGIDPLLQGITQEGVGIVDATREVNPLCNLYFTAASSIVIIALGWYLTDKIVEPRLRATEIDGDPDDMPKFEELDANERKGMIAGLIATLVSCGLLAAWALPGDSALRAPVPAGSDEPGSLTAFSAPLMKSIVPLIFVLFLIPGVVHGYVSKKFKSHRDVIAGMSASMGTMAYYMVMAFFAALFIYSFNESKLGLLLAVKGAGFLKSMQFPAMATIVGIIFLCAFVNLLVGSASAKWALLAPIFVPMLMQLGISPELTQAAYRVGDSTTNIVTPLMPYFPLVVTFCQRYTKKTGLGTVISLMLPYSVCFLIVWTIFLLIYWKLGISLGIGATYTYEVPGAAG